VAAAEPKAASGMTTGRRCFHTRDEFQRLIAATDTAGRHGRWPDRHWKRHDAGVVIPSGATGRFLGTMDAFGWFDNFGSFDVTINGAATPPPPSESAPEPAALILLTSSLAAFHPRGRLSSHDPPGLVN
jgi:hypothetical protein